MRSKLIVLLLVFLPWHGRAEIVDYIATDAEFPEEELTASEQGSIMERDMNLGRVQEAFDNSKLTDNVKRYTWSSEIAPKVRMRQYMPTTIHLPAGESVLSYSFGLDHFLKVQSLGGAVPHMLTLYSEYAGFDTSLTVVGKSGQVYVFYVRVDPVDSPEVPDLLVYVDNHATFSQATGVAVKDDSFQTAAISTTPDVVLPVAAPDYLATVPDSDSVNTEYRIFGDRDISPYAVYDDGNWTYFDYQKGLVSDRQPAVYKVIDGVDAVVNFRYESGFLIAESLSQEGWTLRNGKKTVCIKPSRRLKKEEVAYGTGFTDK